MKNKIRKESLPKQVDETILLLKNLFSDEILGIYLYGSATLGILQPNSDLDILVIMKREVSMVERRILTDSLSIISGKVGCIEKRPLEITIINYRDISPLKFPPKCEYMYGEWLREDIDAGKIIQASYEPDIILLLWQVYNSSITLNGKEPSRLIPVISITEVKKAMKYSLSSLIKNFENDERNVLLTLARMWYTLETEKLTTKDIAAEWVLKKIPLKFRKIIENLKNEYLGKKYNDWDKVKDEAINLVKFMEQHIKNY